MNDRDFAGLRALLESSFPKHCGNCGRVYESVEQFLAETEDMPDGRSSLKSALDWKASVWASACLLPPTWDAVIVHNV